MTHSSVNGRARTLETRFTGISCSPAVLLLKEREQLRASLAAKVDSWLVFWEPGGCLDL